MWTTLRHFPDEELVQLDDIWRVSHGFGSSDTTKEQKAKSKIEIIEILAKAFGLFYRRGETTGIPIWYEIENEIWLEAINISTELVIKQKENNEEEDIRKVVPQEYHHLLDVFEKGEKTTLPLRRPVSELVIDLEEGKRVPTKKI